jgi:acyl carrier protein
MNSDELRDVVYRNLKRIAPECDPSELLPEENIREALDIDSFGFLQVLIGIGEETGIEIPETDYAQVFTLGGMLGYLARRQG